MLKAWSASRSAVLSRDEQIPGQFVYAVVYTAAVNYQTQFIGCFKGIEMDILNNVLFICIFLVYTPNASVLLVIYWCFYQMLNKELKWSAFWKGKIMLLFRDYTDVLYEHSEEGSLYISFRLTETMYFKNPGLSFMGYVMRLWTWKSSICD